MPPLTKGKLDYILKKLNNVLCNKSIYIFGAGASAYHVPIKYDLYDTAIRKLYEMPSYPLEEKKPNNDQLFQLHAWGSPFISENHGEFTLTEEAMEFGDKLLHRYPQFLYLIGAMSYSLEDEHIQYCPEYDFFNFANPQSLFLTLNHDGLATKFINRRVIPLHGEITQQHRSIINQAFHLAFNIDITQYLDANLHMVKKEDESILLKNSHYAELKLRLNERPPFSNICIIGYSFFKKDDYDIYDKITYTLLRDYAKAHNATITIIDKNPCYIADIFSNGLQVNCFEIDWSIFSHAFFDINKIKILQKQNALDLNKFIRLYHYFCTEKTRTFNKSIFNSKTLCL